MVDFRPAVKLLESGVGTKILEEGAAAGKALLNQAGEILAGGKGAQAVREGGHAAGSAAAGDGHLLSTLREAQASAGKSGGDLTKTTAPRATSQPFQPFDESGYRHIAPRAGEEPFRPFDGAGYKHVPSMNVDGAGVHARDASVGASADPFKAYDQSGYRWLPARSLVQDIRTAQGPTLTHADGITTPEIAFGERGIQSIRMPSSFTAEQKADTLVAASYAGLIKTDAAAAHSVSTVERESIGFIRHGKTTAYATPEEMERAAVDGATAYLKNEAGNGFTRHLVERFGPYTAEHRDWGRAILTETGPHSAWNATMGPTDQLLSAGIPINAATRKAAADGAFLKAPPWNREHRIVAEPVDEAHVVSAAASGQLSKSMKDALK